MLQAFRVVAFISTIVFGIGVGAEANAEHCKAFLIAGVLFLAATVIQKFLEVG